MKIDSHFVPSTDGNVYFVRTQRTKKGKPQVLSVIKAGTVHIHYGPANTVFRSGPQKKGKK